MTSPEPTMPPFWVTRFYWNHLFCSCVRKGIPFCQSQLFCKLIFDERGVAWCVREMKRLVVDIKCRIKLHFFLIRSWRVVRDRENSGRSWIYSYWCGFSTSSVSTVDESLWVWLSVAFLFFANCLNQIATMDTTLTKVALSHGGTRDGQRLNFGPGLILAPA